MHRTPARQAFGQKNAKPSPAPEAKKGKDLRQPGADMRPVFAAVGLAVAVGAAGFSMLDVQKKPAPGQGPQITHISGGSQPFRSAARTSNATAPGVGTGAANGSIMRASR
jgi:hypothetical protein